MKLDGSRIHKDLEQASAKDPLIETFNSLARMIVDRYPKWKFAISPSGLQILIDNNQQSSSTNSHPSAVDCQNESRRRLIDHYEEDNDYYINFQPMPPYMIDGRIIGVQMPKKIPIIFRPPSNMKLDADDTYFAAYIFMRDEDNLHGNEILVKCKSFVGDRKTLKTLTPNDWLDQEVINLMVCKLRFFESLSAQKSTVMEYNTWYLPTTFAQYALSKGYMHTKAMDFIKEEFMGNLKFLQKIFIPINDNNDHWYLLVVDIYERKLLILDSLPCVARDKHRKLQVHRLAIYLDELNDDDKFIYKHVISDFPIVVPKNLGRQEHGSGDCGVWVCKWMKDCGYSNDYHEVQVNPSTRMQIALNLVNCCYNELKEDIFRKAVQHWDASMAKP
ncbi:uncharacterized protein LOC109789341 isoform X2 [Cajanus cajan]|nr:uncharacterized protein LOC109789341 isoform X2 [Cajanus cajan]